MSLTLPDWFWVSARSRLSEYPHQAPVAEKNCVWRNSESGVSPGSGKWAEQCVHIVAWVTWYNTGLSPGQINTAPWKPSRHLYFQNKLGPQRREPCMQQYVMYQNTIIKSILTIRGPAPPVSLGRLGWMISNIRWEMCKYDSNIK